MPVRKRTLKRRQGLDSSARAWLDGDFKTAGFFCFKPDEELQALWDEYGDKAAMQWQPPMLHPVKRQ